MVQARRDAGTNTAHVMGRGNVFRNQCESGRLRWFADRRDSLVKKECPEATDPGGAEDSIASGAIGR